MIVSNVEWAVYLRQKISISKFQRTVNSSKFGSIKLIKLRFIFNNFSDVTRYKPIGIHPLFQFISLLLSEFRAMRLWNVYKYTYQASRKKWRSKIQLYVYMKCETVYGCRYIPWNNLIIQQQHNERAKKFPQHAP